MTSSATVVPSTLKQSVDDHELLLPAEITREQPFRLDKDFVESFRDKEPPFGFNGFGSIVFSSHYSRRKENGDSERWYETVERVVNGMYNMQKMQVESQNLGWKVQKAQRSAQECYQRIFELKFTPPGRGLWAMGSPLTEKARLYAALNNCAFVSTEDIGTAGMKVSEPFATGMDMLMLGIGLGFDTEGAGLLKAPKKTRLNCGEMYCATHVVEDSREGWVKSLELLIDCVFEEDTPHIQDLEFDYSQIRPSGVPLKIFGGTSGGPQCLIDLHNAIREILITTHCESRASSHSDDCFHMTSRTIVDMMNHIGVCVVAGNVRRSAQISFGRRGDTHFIQLKNYELNPERLAYGWASNNSVFCNVGDDYTEVAKLTQQNGEPGYCWLENMRKFSRMNGRPDNKDMRVKGGNPCLEQSLESYEVCCLVETFIARHESMEDFLRTLKFAFLYAKTVTLGSTPWVRTNRVMLRNRRIGCSVTGVAQFLGKHKNDWNILRKWLRKGYKRIEYYDRVYSDWLTIPRSIKLTSVKPSGTVSLLAGATPGAHYAIAGRFVLRRKRFSSMDPRDQIIFNYLKNRGYPTEDDLDSKTSVIVSFPIDHGVGVRIQSEVTMWEQLELVAFLQEHWSDNQVSATVTFDEQEGSHISHALQIFQFKLKGVSFLPKENTTIYKQPPYTAITEEQYNEYMRNLTPLVPSELYELLKQLGCPQEAPPAERYCDGDQCFMDDVSQASS